MRGEPSTGELQALAARQQQQLDTQARLIAAREHRLRQVILLRPLSFTSPGAIQASPSVRRVESGVSCFV